MEHLGTQRINGDRVYLQEFAVEYSRSERKLQFLAPMGGDGHASLSCQVCDVFGNVVTRNDGHVYIQYGRSFVVQQRLEVG